MITLLDVRQKTGPLPGGAVDLYLILAEDVDNIPDAVEGAISTDITVKAGSSFKKIEFAPGTCKISHPSVGEDGSGSMETLVDFIVGSDDAATLAMFNDMINGRFIAIVDQASRVKRLAGSKRAPLILRAVGYDGGADQPDRNATTFQLKSRDGRISPEYQGVVQTEVA